MSRGRIGEKNELGRTTDHEAVMCLVLGQRRKPNVHAFDRVFLSSGELAFVFLFVLGGCLAVVDGNMVLVLEHSAPGKFNDTLLQFAVLRFNEPRTLSNGSER